MRGATLPAKAGNGPSATRCPMLEKLDFMMRFWNLMARHGAKGDPLSSVEQIELLSLIRLMASDLPLPEAGPPPLFDTSTPVELTAPGGFLRGELRMVCASGVVIACAAPLRVGQSTLLRLADEEGGVEYTLPCVVCWSYRGAQPAMALRVDGVPTQMNAVDPEPGMWRSPLGLGTTEAPLTQTE
jgi:hypothetical protein